MTIKANITSMGESIFSVLSKAANRIATGYVIRTVNEALSYWLTWIHARCVVVKEHFTARLAVRK